MIRIGIFSDVHGNWVALQRIWEELAKRDAISTLTINAGDSVAYGKQPEECVQFLRSQPRMLHVRGNYDKNVARYPEEEDRMRQKWKRTRPEKLEAIQAASESISEESRLWLLGLPTELEFFAGSYKGFLSHYSPGQKRGFGAWTTNAELELLATRTDAQIIVGGHTHSAFTRWAGEKLWINPGAVGERKSRRAFGAVLSLEEDRPPSAEIFQLITP